MDILKPTPNKTNLEQQLYDTYVPYLKLKEIPKQIIEQFLKDVAMVERIKLQLN